MQGIKQSIQDDSLYAPTLCYLFRCDYGIRSPDKQELYICSANRKLLISYVSFGRRINHVFYPKMDYFILI